MTDTDKEFAEPLRQIIEINALIAKQNATIVQSLTMPSLITGGSENE